MELQALIDLEKLACNFNCGLIFCFSLLENESSDVDVCRRASVLECKYSYVFRRYKNAKTFEYC